ncbi:hypothetical protein Syun_011454 [Stephania yunnanensis]|uniref:ABC transporter domain-containing protein n=1 Tax=Stephania yunnanensis TaxID=152371 RepID=A0AAP0JYA6_9MAGN
MKGAGVQEDRLHSLRDVTGAALMGVSGAGKTTLMMFLQEERQVDMLKEILDSLIILKSKTHLQESLVITCNYQ